MAETTIPLPYKIYTDTFNPRYCHRLLFASFMVKVGDVIAIKENKRDKEMFKALKGMKVVMPKWLEFNPDTLTGKILALPKREDVDMNISEHLIIELYSR